MSGSSASGFSTGLLLATATLHLLPEALASGLGPREAFPRLLGGMRAFFMLKRVARWRHARAGTGESDTHSGDLQYDDHTHRHHHLQREAGG